MAPDIFPLWDYETAGEFRKKVPVIHKNDIPAKAPIPRVKTKKSGRKTRLIDDIPSKNCIICNAIFYRKRWHTDDKWEKLVVCPNKTCIGKYARSQVKKKTGVIAKKYPPKICVICGKMFEKIRRGMCEAWEKQQTCSISCSGKLIALNAIEDDSEPDIIAIDPIIKMSEITVSIPDIVLVEIQGHAVKNNVSTNDVAMVAMIEYLLQADSENRTIKTTIRKLFKKEVDAKPNKRDNPKPSKI
jgi:hypothetical protein